MKDVLQTTTGDLLLTDNGSGLDISWGESTLQHQRDLLVQRKGDDGWHPEVGVGSEDFIGDDEDDFLRMARTEFVNDGMTVKTLAIVGGKLKVNATYE